MKVLITGASGFVGKALFRRCQSLGWEVIGIGRRPIADRSYQSRDLTQPLSLDFRPDVVVHAAARSSPWGTLREFEIQNMHVTKNVVAFCRSHGVPRLIYVSTAAVLYRNEHQLGMDENTPVPPRAINHYARTKLSGEMIVRGYDAGKWCILRPRAVFGPGDTVLFPRILRAAIRRRLPWIDADQTVWGDLIYIDCLTDYIIRAAVQEATGVYHLTNNQPVPILEFLADILTRLGLPRPHRRVSARQALCLASAVESLHRIFPFLGEPVITRFGVSVFAYSKTFNVAKTIRDLGPPSVSLDEGVQRFIDWQMPFLPGKRSFRVNG